MAASKGPFWPCDVCRVIRPTPVDLAHHVMKGQQHKENLSRTAPDQLQNSARLQPFLDTYIKGYPIVGLEYIVEEQLDSETYQYTCQLCHSEGDMFKIFTHILAADHMERYIGKHHSKLSVKAGQYWRKAHYLKALRSASYKIHRHYGRKSVQMKESSIKAPPVAEEAPPLAEEAPPLAEEAPTPAEEAPPLVEEASPPAEEAPPPCPKVNVKKNGPVLHDGNGLTKCRTCHLCDEFFPSALSLCSHVMGNKHKKKLSQSAPNQLKELGRLQYFLEAHLKDDPLLGLEHIVEEQLDFSRYKYTCQLCDVEGDFPLMVTHVTDVRHVECYVERHHSELSLKKHTYPHRVDYVKALTKIASVIYEKHGRKNIHVKPTVISRTAPAKVAAQFPKDNGKKVGTVSPNGIDLNKRRICSLCGALCNSTVELCIHVIGYKHRKNLSLTAPEEVNEVGRLQYFLDTYAKEDPLLGLEYILEEQLDSTSYKYTCQLCLVDGDLVQIVTHITDEDHMESYIDRHHNKLSLKACNYSSRTEYERALTALVLELHTTYGRKGYQLKTTDRNGPAPAKVAKLTLDDNSKKVGPLPSRSKVKIKQRSQNSPRHETELDEMTPMEELGFTSNIDFLKYLQNFKIENDEDASFIQQINQNCTNALLRFWTDEIAG